MTATRDTTDAYETAAERKLAERAEATLHWITIRRREGQPAVSAEQLAGRYGWTWRAATHTLQHLEARGAVRRYGRVWALTDFAGRQ
jgi:RNA-splicing ligase RtcB